MKVLILSTYEKTGGAAIAAQRLMYALRKSGVDATMLCRKNLSWWPGKPQSWTSIFERGVIWLCNGFSMKRLWLTDIALFGQDITKTKEYKEADVIHLHWINQGFLSLKTIDKICKSGKKVVWTMHDMWNCTSVCHHAGLCDYYKLNCSKCSVLNSCLSNKIYKVKEKIFSNQNVDVVAVSSWLADKAEQSAIFKNLQIRTIPNFICIDEFKLLDKQLCRNELGISQSKKIITFCASRIDDPIKGFRLLVKALNHLMLKDSSLKDVLQLRLIGEIKNNECLDNIPVEYVQCGLINDKHKQSVEYNASDIIVSSSEYETFGQTLIEAQACGCIPVSFGNSGQRDIITHLKTGFLVEEHTALAFCKGLEWAINTNIDRTVLRDYILERFSEESVAKRYIEVYVK